DDEEAVRRNYEFPDELEVDAAYCQILTPYPKTKLRESLLAAGLVTNHDNYERYNGFWANVETRHLDAAALQYAFWHYRQTALGWWRPSDFAKRQGRLWTLLWTHLVKPVMKYFADRKIRRVGWQGQYQRHLERLELMNRFPDLERFEGKTGRVNH
ncbi:MAG: radical SAM protein, partial [Syntrophales bacterium LBB04]|nr:radical SAM protein [Syntrophales bacterium LBB04]